MTSIGDDSLIERLKERVKTTAKRSKIVTSKGQGADQGIDEHLCRDVRSLPSISSFSQKVPKSEAAKHSAVRFFLNSMNEGKSLTDILPIQPDLSKIGIIRNPAFVDAIDPKVIEEHEKELNIQKAMLQQEEDTRKDSMREEHKPAEEPAEETLEEFLKRSEKEAEQRSVLEEERPESPGCQYDKLYIPAEIGVKQSRFRADVHEKMMKMQNGDNRIKQQDLQKFISKAVEVENELKRQYERHSDIKAVERNMIHQFRKKLKQKQE